jgi:hypothetical protein
MRFSANSAIPILLSVLQFFSVVLLKTSLTTKAFFTPRGLLYPHNKQTPPHKTISDLETATNATAWAGKTSLPLHHHPQATP